MENEKNERGEDRAERERKRKEKGDVKRRIRRGGCVGVRWVI